MSNEMIADVALRVRLGSAARTVFSYRVPPRLQAVLQPGQLVWAPLRRAQVQGVVLALRAGDERTETGDLRDLIDLADPAAIATTAGLQLARWVATTYRAPLYEALALVLPPGVGQEAEPIWQATGAGLAAALGSLPERERGVLYFLRSHGASSERDLHRRLRGSPTELREACMFLRERGLVEQQALRSSRRVRPRRERIALLQPPPADPQALLAELARAPRRQAVARWLLDQPQTALWERDGDGRPIVPLAQIAAATGATPAMLRALEQRGLIELNSREVRRDPLAGDGVPPDQPLPLTAGQRRVWDTLNAALAASPTNEPASGPVFLLHGVTGSGKTEIYLRAIARVLRLERQALVLVPEIALTAQLVRRFAARFPGRLAVLHSGLSLGERYDEWRRLRSGAAQIAIGSRSAVFAPLPELGLIIVDEEHEASYKHDAGPRYHARDAALQLGALTGSVVVLGSATPSVESYYAAQCGRYQLLELHERVGARLGADGLPRARELPLPPVRLVDMRREIQHGNRSIFSRPLQQQLAVTLERNEQAILFLNRRGAAAFVLCRDCGAVVSCPACSAPLVVHYLESLDPDSGGEPEGYEPLLICHSCRYRSLIPAACPQCLSPRIKAFGVGTQRVVEEVRRLFPTARVVRWDRDTVGGKGAHRRLLDQFLEQRADVLVGTQMIAKGLDLPLVSLVGVVAADTALHLPDFRSGERTFQLLAQVAGRAGRRAAGAAVVIQTYNPEHYALQAAREHDYAGFYLQEIAFRRQAVYPPFSRLVRFVYAGGSESACQRATEQLAEQIRAAATRLCLADWSLIGPAPAFLRRVRGRWRWHLIVRIGAGNPIPALLTALGPLRGWMVDIDPVNVL